jgi:hypothetical protein
MHTTVWFHLPALLLLIGCASPSPGNQRGARAAEQTPPREGGSGSQTVAAIDGEPVAWSELIPAMAELSGGQALDELALDRRLARELARRGISIGTADIERERGTLLRSLADVPGADPAALRRRRGLGPARYDAILRRSASLRALVAPEISVTDEELDRAAAIRSGTRYATRLIVVPTQAEAASIRERLRTSGGDITTSFAGEAVLRSADSSATRGGAIGEISPDDPTWPASLRAAIARTPGGTVSDILALDAGFGLVLVEAVTAPQPADRDAIGRELRVRKERAAMDRAAKSLSPRAGVSAIEPSLRWSAE